MEGQFPSEYQPQPPVNGEYLKQAHRFLRKDLNRVGWALFVFMLLIQLVSGVLMVVASVIWPRILESMWFVVGLNILCIYGIAFPVFYLIIRGAKTFDIPGRVSLPLPPSRFMIILLIGYAMTYVGNLVSLAVTFVISLLKGSEVVNPLLDMLSEPETLGAMIPYFIYMVVVAPIMEELVFRKILLDRVRKYGDKFAIFICGFAFALFHGNLNQLLYAFLLGSVFAYVTLRTGKVRYGMMMHAIINFVGFSAALLLVVEDEMISLALLGVFGLVVLGVVITGGVMFFVYRKKIFLQSADTPICRIPKTGDFFKSPGMLAYTLLVVALIAFVTLMPATV